MLNSRNLSVLLLLGSATFAGAWNFTFLAPILHEVADGTGVSVSAAGQLVTVAAGVTVLALVLFGPLSDRYGRRTMLALGLAAMAAAAFGSSVTSSYGLLLALRVVSGIGDALVIPSAAATAADYFEGKDREVALNVLVIPMGAAAVVGLPAVVLITEAAGWHAAFLAFGIVNLAVAFAAMRFLPSAAPPAPSSTLSQHYHDAYGEVMGSSSALLVLMAAILGAAVWNGMVTYAGAFFEDEAGVEGSGLSLLFGGLGLAYVLGAAAGISLARRVEPRLIAFWSAVAGIIFLPMMTGFSALAPLAVLFGLLFAAFRAPGIAALNNMLLDMAPGSRGTAISVYGVVAAGGAVIGAATGGSALEVGGYMGMASLFSVFAGVGALILLRLEASPAVSRASA